jgi:hypothetical protein
MMLWRRSLEAKPSSLSQRETSFFQPRNEFNFQVRQSSRPGQSKTPKDLSFGVLARFRVN